MRMASTIAALVVSVCVLTHGASRDAAVLLANGISPQALVLSAAPQDGEVFVTWSPVPGAMYTVRWKPVGASEWVVINAGTATSRAVTGLVNGVAHVFQIEARLLDGTPISSASVTSTPRPRPDCVALDYYPWLPPASFFCTKAALDAYLSDQALDPLALRCRQRQVTTWNSDSPDCLYTIPGGQQLLLLRSADAFFAGSNQYPLPADVRRYARQAIWGAGDPFMGQSSSTWIALPQPVIGNVTGHAQAQSFQIALAWGLSSRITWFVPSAPVDGRFAIYHEGHGGAAVEIGAETIDWLLARGWQVIAVDMPLIGLNSVDARPGLEAHGQFDLLDDGVTSPIAYFLTPVQSLVDRIFDGSGNQDVDLLLIGRSGGGLTTYIYGAVDPRIDVAVSVAGGRPISERLEAPWGAAELGDYEQTAPHLYNVVAHEHLMLAAGTKGSFYLFNLWDTCCFRIQRDSAFVQYLLGASSVLGKPVGVFVDETNFGHSIGPQGYVELGRYLDQVQWRRTPTPNPPTGFRIVRESP